MPGSDLKLIFLGTGALLSKFRASSSVAIWQQSRSRRRSGVDIFDAGEGVRVSLERSNIHPKHVRRIFITSTKFRKILGVFSLLEMVSAARANAFNAAEKKLGETPKWEPIEVYGPEGIRSQIRAIIKLGDVQLQHPFSVSELKNVPYYFSPKHPKKYKDLSMNGSLSTRARGEVLVSDIFPTESSSGPVWKILKEEKHGYNIVACPMNYSSPSVGYVFEEYSMRRGFNRSVVEEHIKRNMKELEKDMKKPALVFKTIENLKPNESFVFPDGTVLARKDAMPFPKKGRKICILGTSCGWSQSIIDAAKDSDVVIHGVWGKGGKNSTELTLRGGKSTPQMAGKFARRIEARMILLTQFQKGMEKDPQRYIKDMARIKDIVRNYSGLKGDQVMSAWDLMELPVHSKDWKLRSEFSVPRQKTLNKTSGYAKKRAQRQNRQEQVLSALKGRVKRNRIDSTQ